MLPTIILFVMSVSLPEQDTTRKGRVYKMYGNAMYKNTTRRTVFGKESEAGHDPEICFPGAGSTWEPALAVRHLWMPVSTFFHDSNFSSH